MAAEAIEDIACGLRADAGIARVHRDEHAAAVDALFVIMPVVVADVTFGEETRQATGRSPAAYLTRRGKER